MILLGESKERKAISWLGSICFDDLNSPGKDALDEMASFFGHNIILKNRKRFEEIYEKVFIASESARLFVNNDISANKRDAIKLGERPQKEIKLFYLLWVVLNSLVITSYADFLVRNGVAK